MNLSLPHADLYNCCDNPAPVRVKRGVVDCENCGKRWEWDE